MKKRSISRSLATGGTTTISQPAQETQLFFSAYDTLDDDARERLQAAAVRIHGLSRQEGMAYFAKCDVLAELRQHPDVQGIWERWCDEELGYTARHVRTMIAASAIPRDYRPQLAAQLPTVINLLTNSTLPEDAVRALVAAAGERILKVSEARQIVDKHRPPPEPEEIESPLEAAIREANEAALTASAGAPVAAGADGSAANRKSISDPPAATAAPPVAAVTGTDTDTDTFDAVDAAMEEEIQAMIAELGHEPELVPLTVSQLESAIRSWHKQSTNIDHAILRLMAKTRKGDDWDALAEFLGDQLYYKNPLVQALNNVASQLEAEPATPPVTAATGTTADAGQPYRPDTVLVELPRELVEKGELGIPLIGQFAYQFQRACKDALAE